MPGNIKEQGFRVWGVFDEAARLRADPSRSGFARGWDPDFVLQCVASGDIVMADTIEALAGKCGMRPGALRVTIDQFNEDIVGGKDRWFLRSMEELFPIAEAPFGPDSGPLSQLRKSQAAVCSSAEALALTTVIHE